MIKRLVFVAKIQGQCSVVDVFHILLAEIVWVESEVYLSLVLASFDAFRESKQVSCIGPVPELRFIALRQNFRVDFRALEEFSLAVWQHTAGGAPRSCFLVFADDAVTAGTIV